MKAKKTDEPYRIKQFKLSDRDWWCGHLHYHLYENGELVMAAGGIETEESRQKIQDYLKRKKIHFNERTDT